MKPRCLVLLFGLGCALAKPLPARAASLTLTGAGETGSVITTGPRGGSERAAFEACVPCGINKVEAVTRYGQWILGEEALTTLAPAAISGEGETAARPLAVFVESRLAAYGIPASDTLVRLISRRVVRYVPLERFLGRGIVRYGPGSPGSPLIVLRPSSLPESEWKRATLLVKDENEDRAATASEIRRMLAPRL